MGKTTGSKGGWFTRFYAKHPIISHLVFIMATAFALLLIAALFLRIWTRHGANATVPDTRGMQYSEAVAELSSEGFEVEITDSVYDESLAAGTVIESWPRPGAVVKDGRTIYLTITSFEPRKVRVDMPLSNVSSRQAQSYLESLGLRNVRLVSVYSEYIDLVISAKHDGKEIQIGDLLPVNAVVVLEVGVRPEVQTVEVDSIGEDDIDIQADGYGPGASLSEPESNNTHMD